MRSVNGRLAIAVFGILTACLAAGCGTSSSSSAYQNGKSGRLPSPFTVVARYSARSLGLTAPQALAVGRDKNVYVTDFSQRVAVISPEGKVLRRWGKSGSGPGQFHFVSTDPTAPKELLARLTVGPNGMVYVSDSGNARVEAFTPQGRFVRQFGSSGSGRGQFVGTFDLAVDGDGNVYVLDDQRPGLVTKFSPNGRVVWQIGGASSSDPDLAGHLHLASIDSHGRLVMMNDDQGRVIYVDRDGHKLDAFDGGGAVFPAGHGGCEVTVDTAGNTYVTGCGRGGGCVSLVCAGTVVFDRTHRPIAEFARAQTPLSTSPRFGPDGEVFALGSDGSLIKLRVTLAGG
jgi:hypothetical protein